MSHMQTKDFLVGAAVGSLLGTVSALLIAPKSGKKLRNDICDMYCDITDRTQDLASNVSKKSRNLANTVSSQASSWAGRAKNLVSDAADNAPDWFHSDEEHTVRDLFIGGIAGGLLGAVAGLLLAPKAGDELRRDLADTYEDVSERTQDFADQVSKKGKYVAKKVGSQANEWIELLKDIVDYAAEELQGVGENVTEKSKQAASATSNRMNDIIHWASLGFRMWQNMKKRR